MLRGKQGWAAWHDGETRVGGGGGGRCKTPRLGFGLVLSVK